MATANTWKKETAQGLLEAGWKLREQGEYCQSAQLLMQAVFQFQELGDPWMIAECFNHLGIGFKNLFRQSQDSTWAILTEHCFNAAYEIMDTQNLTDEQIAFQAPKLGEAALVNQKFAKAIEFFQLAIDKDQNHTSASLGNNQHHLGLAKFLLGRQQNDYASQQEGRELIEQGIQLIKEDLEKEKSTSQKTQLWIWYTGGLLALTRVLYAAEPEKAYDAVKKAISIANRENLTIRIDQAQSLLKAIESNDEARVRAVY